MTGQQVWEQALALLNYTDGEGRPGVQGGSALRGRALYLVNQMLRELWNTEQSAAFAPLAHLSEAVWLSERPTEWPCCWRRVRATTTIMPYSARCMRRSGRR